MKPVGVTVAVLLVALLLAAELGGIYRGVKAPSGYDQSRLHWNTKNSTRFAGGDGAEVAALVSRAVRPATVPENTPSTVMLYDDADWEGGLAATSLPRPLNGVLLPASTGAEEIAWLNRTGSATVGGSPRPRVICRGGTRVSPGHERTPRLTLAAPGNPRRSWYV